MSAPSEREQGSLLSYPGFLSVLNRPGGLLVGCPPRVRENRGLSSLTPVFPLCSTGLVVCWCGACPECKRTGVSPLLPRFSLHVQPSWWSVGVVTAPSAREQGSLLSYPGFLSVFNRPGGLLVWCLPRVQENRGLSSLTPVFSPCSTVLVVNWCGSRPECKRTGFSEGRPRSCHTSRLKHELC